MVNETKSRGARRKLADEGNQIFNGSSLSLRHGGEKAERKRKNGAGKRFNRASSARYGARKRRQRNPSHHAEGQNVPGMRAHAGRQSRTAYCEV